MQPRGGKREGAGRKAGPSTITRSVRTTKEGWQWLNDQAWAAGFKSVGSWAKASSTIEARANAVAKGYYWYDRLHSPELFDKNGRRIGTDQQKGEG